jgi:hypothetical protein
VSQPRGATRPLGRQGRGASLRQERLPRWGQPDATGQPLEERPADLGLQGGELLGQRWLGDVQAPGRPSEVALVDDGDEVEELPERDARKLTIANGYGKRRN